MPKVNVPNDEDGERYVWECADEAMQNGEEVDLDALAGILREMRMTAQDEDDAELRSEYQDEEDVRRHHP